VLSSAAPASAVERLKHKRFEECSPAELAALAALVRRVTLSMAPRVTRRYDAGQRGRLDTRRMVRGSWRTGGELSTIARRERRWRRRRMVIVLDVSGSMAAYSRALLVFAHASVTVDARWEAFCFATRLTRLTGALRTQHPDAALRAASEEVVDWDGGTRIGESLKTLVDEHGHGRLLRGSVVIICSDGLDVGRPELLGEQMARLARLARTVVWVNPLRASPGYAPLAGGMAAALPHVDVFADGHNLDSLESVARRLGERGRAHRPRR
jgi:uncharacterized protein with von Willebrand factor type A (vWA) domain